MIKKKKKSTVAYNESILTVSMCGDAKDLNEFEREAKEFNIVNNVPRDNLLFIHHKLTRYQRRHKFEMALERHSGKISTIAFFGHGWKGGIQLGYNIKTIDRMVEAISKHCVSPVKILLYSCTTGDALNSDDINVIKDGFADKLRDEMNANGVRGEIMAHDRAGHTTRNPYAKRVIADGYSETDEDWEWYVEPKRGCPIWNKWRRELRNTDFRFTFAFATNEQIAFWLGAD